MDIAVTNSGTEKEGGTAGSDRTGSEVWAGCRPISFPGRSSPSLTCGPCCRSGSGRITGRCCGRPWPPRGWASCGSPCRRRASCGGTGRGIGESSGRETACSGQPRPQLAAAAASSGVCAIQSLLQRWMSSSVVLKARGLIRLLMWRDNLRRKRAVCASFIDSGCRAVRLSHKTEGLVLRHMG